MYFILSLFFVFFFSFLTLVLCHCKNKIFLFHALPNFYKYFLKYESLILRISKLQGYCENSTEILHRLQVIAFKFYYNFKPYEVFTCVFKRSDVSELIKLSRNRDVIVCKPDKGRGIVLINKDMYVSKMLDIISDVTKFECISVPFDRYTRKIEDKINYFLRKIKDSIVCDADVFKRLFASGSAPGVMYGLPKIHKPDFANKYQFRPIFAAYNNSMFSTCQIPCPCVRAINY